MSHVEITRLTLGFPWFQQGLPNAQSAGVPAAPGLGGFQMSTLSAVNDTNAIIRNQADESGQRVDIPRGTTAISIAPDSAIRDCDVALLGKQSDGTRHRVSPGNPLIGCLDAESAVITIPWSIPLIEVSLDALGGTTRRRRIVGDGVRSSQDNGYPIFGFPLRLEFWSGDLLPVRSSRRATYGQHFAVYAGAAGIVEEQILVCVDGRNRVDVTVYPINDNVVVSVYGLRGWKALLRPVSDGTIDELLPLDDAGATTAVVTAATAKTFSFYGNAHQVFRVHVNQSGGVTTGALTQVKVQAEDEG